MKNHPVMHTVMQGKTWEDRLGEDRTYLVHLSARRMLRA